jgi:presenilin-like A22 family membrane protease
MNVIQRFARNTTARVGIAGSLLTFFWRRKLWWMTPLVAVLLVLGILVIFGQSSAISAFIYTIF